ncbi:hypothetical protein P8625_00705 [Tenacibaculum tangerinum]|uniref:Uncharacterized protein n=1 Tax=Tenacibaculum tangerinum TaxID=3038772 RepID=A0ABY8L2W3_9FLAO|nr:hypothetical protein [Tenacibaculum tangerinum]WGH75715.1 hypothetical protein P8625_00705 [Tenacibaculum tangerinum]
MTIDSILSKKQEHAFLLYLKLWRKEIPVACRNVIIAEALNHCVYYENMMIKGYWLRDKKLYLIIHTEAQNVEELLEVFAKQVLRGIHQYNQQKEKYTGMVKKANVGNELFLKFPLNDVVLQKLLTGKKIAQVYTQYVVKITNQMNQSNYCSVVDYSGALGPVKVTID